MRAAVVVLVVALASRAHADPTVKFSIEGWYAKLGVELGSAFVRDRGAGFVGGGVATLVHLDDDSRWYGLQLDVLSDSNGDADTGTRFSFGPEAGYKLVGGSVGLFGERVAGDTRYGIDAMGKLTVGLIALYVRAAHVTTSDVDPTSVEVGVQLKMLVWTN